MPNYEVSKFGRAVVISIDSSSYGDDDLAIGAPGGTGVIVAHVPAARALALAILALCPEDESEAGSGGSAGRGTIDSPNPSVDGDHTTPSSGGVEDTIEVL